MVVTNIVAFNGYSNMEMGTFSIAINLIQIEKQLQHPD